MKKKKQVESKKYKKLTIEQVERLVTMEEEVRKKRQVDPIIVELRNDIKMISKIQEINYRTETFLSIIADYTFILSILEEREEYETCKEIMDELIITPTIIEVVEEVEGNVHNYIKYALEEFKKD
jgi:hypothetical protein